MKIRLEPATPHDLSDILALQKRAFYGEAVLYDDFTLPPLRQTLEELTAEFGRSSIYKVEAEGEIVASIRCHVREHTLHVERLIVAPELQNQGVGSGMLEQLEGKYAGTVARYALFTGDKSARNLHLYRKCGYKEVSRQPLNDRCALVLLEKQAPCPLA